MNGSDILNAKREAERFLDRVRDFEDVIARDSHKRRYWHITGCPESAAMKRASMDLTRALSKMRNPQ